MNRIAVFFSEGYEEIEALTVVDICRRCGLDVDMVAVGKERSVKGSHDIVVGMDKLFEEADLEEYDMIVLPGGLKGTQGLESHEGLMAQIDDFYAKGKYIAAVCAAPSIFGHRGILKGRKACSYPSFESHLEGAVVTPGPVEVSDHVITSRGMGTSIDFALAIVRVFCGEQTAAEMAEKIVYHRD